MAQQGLSQREMARRLGWSQQYFWRRIAGKHEFSASDLEQVARVLDVPVDRFLRAPERAA